MGRVVDLSELQKIRTSLRQQNKKVVFTNGCFDLIHRGHVEYLSKAKSLGDVLFVGLNSDDSVHRMKGNNRPIIPLEDRAVVVAHLSPVDYVCVFDDDTPLELISALIPDVLVKGADWEINHIVGRDIVEKAGGRVVTIEFLPNRSTSGIIKQILERFA